MLVKTTYNMYGTIGRAVQLYNVGVTQKLKVLDLSFDSPGHIATDELLSRDDFESDLLLGNSMDRELDLSERPFS